MLGPQVCTGYVDSSLDADAFDDDGWFRTGDLGVIDDEGYVELTGRLKDIIIRKGENISAQGDRGPPLRPPEGRRRRRDRPARRRARRAGVRRGGARRRRRPAHASRRSPTFLREHRLSVHKLPEQLEIVEALPRNPTGKVLKHELRAEHSEASRE